MRGKDRHNYGEEEEDEVRWMRRMRRDRFFRNCKKRSDEEEVRRMRRIRRLRMRKEVLQKRNLSWVDKGRLATQ